MIVKIVKCSTDYGWYESHVGKVVEVKDNISGLYEVIGEIGLGFVPKEDCEVVEMETLKDGWIPWSGGKCPVDGDTYVDVKFRDGSIDSWQGKYYDWFDDCCQEDIIAYRVVDE